MKIEQFFDDESSTFSYLIGSKERNACLIDPVKKNIEKYEEKLNNLEMNLVYALDTHIHADHITGLGKLREKFGCETVMGFQSNVSCVSRLIKDNEIILIDELSIRSIYTPGHTDDSYSYLLKNNEEQFLFTGDTLLIGGSGRTDFQNGNPSSLYNSLHNKLLKLDDETIIYPAHDYEGFKSSTIKKERLNNKRLQMNKETFIKSMNNQKLNKPKLIDIAIPLNLSCGIEEEI
jgi:glyoxylase-like metal-dependent hydrolase (beta-lactamase superfamily II)